MHPHPAMSEWIYCRQQPFQESSHDVLLHQQSFQLCKLKCIFFTLFTHQTKRMTPTVPLTKGHLDIKREGLSSGQMKKTDEKERSFGLVQLAFHTITN